MKRIGIGDRFTSLSHGRRSLCIRTDSMQALIQRGVWLRVSETISTIDEAPIYFKRGIGPVPRHVSTDQRILVSRGCLGKSLRSSMDMSR